MFIKINSRNYMGGMCMTKTDFVKEFSMKKEVLRLILYIILALLFGFISLLYLYNDMYFRAAFLSLGTLSWSLLSLLCIKKMKVAYKWIKSGNCL